jgi:hypothetical protein
MQAAGADICADTQEGPNCGHVKVVYGDGKQSFP